VEDGLIPFVRDITPVPAVAPVAKEIVGCVTVKVELAPITDLVDAVPRSVTAVPVVPFPAAVITVAPFVSLSATVPVATVVAEEAALGTVTSPKVNWVVV
jgi:hypothetical protein